MKNNQITVIILILFIWITGCSNNNKVNTNQTVQESVNKEPKYVIKNRYILKDYYLVDNKNCINKPCGKAIFFYNNLRGCLVIDFDNKKYTKRNMLLYKGDNQIRYGDEPFYVMQDIYNSNRFNLYNAKDARYIKNEYYRVGKIYKNAFAQRYLKKLSYYGYKVVRERLKKDGFKEPYRIYNPGLINKSSQNQTNKIITKFITKNHLAHSLGGEIVSKEWKPTQGNDSQSVNGKGTIFIKNNDKSIYIKGVFNNNSISSGTLSLSQYFRDGSLLGKRHRKTIQLSTNQNLKKAIEQGFRKLANEINGIKQRKANSSSVSSSPNYPHCGANDTCYETVKIESRKATIRCTKGLYTGSEKCISVNSSGDWATGCGFSDISAHHYTFSKAANGACGQ